jgi:DNA-binding winged helix-turn-helix (wHTH) protein
VLVQRSEEVVFKDDLMQLVSAESFVEESDLSQNIFLLRKALGETARCYIFTIPGRGYRFAATAAELATWSWNAIRPSERGGIGIFT